MSEVTNKFNFPGTVDRKTSAERVADLILDMLRSGNLQPSETMPSETQLAKALNVSRPVIREAYRGLQIAGILETRQGGRCSVTNLDPARISKPFQFLAALDPDHFESLFEARYVVETELVRLGTPKATAEDILHLKKLVVTGYELVGDPTSFRAMDSEFHRTLYRLCGNYFLDQTAQTYYGIGGDFRKIASETEGVLRRSAEEHEQIVSAIVKRDIPAAVKAMRGHLESIAKTTQAAMGLSPR